MLTVAVTAALTTILAQPLPYPPDESDLLRGADQHPMIELLLDVSCSMANSPIATPCAWYSAAVGNDGPYNQLNKNKMMEAALIGCRTDSDGVLDRWDQRASFAVRYFGDGSSNNTSLVANFNANHADLENAVRGAGAVAGTPMSAAIGDAGRDFSRILTEDPTPPGGRVTTLACRRNFILLLSDGEPNSGDGTAGPPGCNGVGAQNIPEQQPWVGANYYMTAGDMLCDVADDQRVGTYTIGFGAPGSFSPTYLTNIANSGQGRYFYASNVESLNRAFERIILSIAERAVVYGSGGTVQRQGLFSGGVNYLASYRTVDGGPWVGNIKRICVTPRPAVPPRGPAGEARYDITDNRCMLRATTPTTLVPNPTPLDQYSGTNSLNSDVGGVGAILRGRVSDGVGRATPTTPRQLYTYFPEAAPPTQVRLQIPALTANTITDRNLWVPSGDTWKVINRLLGYSYENNPNNGFPLQTALWPVGDAVHASPVLVRYTANCAGVGECYVVLPTNNGVVHVFDAQSGVETTAFVPGELWSPSDLVHHNLADIERQPTLETARRFYIDGPAQLFHRDANGDGVVDPGDSAYLIFGLGRGGRVYYAMDFSFRFPAGPPPAAKPVAGYAGTAFADLQDTWSQPFLGRVEFNNVFRNVAIFASGHITRFDRHNARVPGLTAGNTIRYMARDTCDAVATANGLPPATSCALNIPSLFNPGLDIPVGPFAMPNAIRYRIHFSRFSLSGSDRVYITDGNDRWANVLASSGGASSEEPLSGGLVGGWTNWVYGPEFYVRLVSEAGRAIDLAIDAVEWEVADPDPDQEHFPNIYAVALDGPDGWINTGPTLDGRRDNRMILARLTRNCGGDRTNCVDPASPGDTADLQHMTCPVSGEVSVVNFSNELRLYWGDECGQIFVATNPSRSRRVDDWTVRRLAHLSWGRDALAPDMSDQNTSLGLSRDVRKLFRRLDVVASTCPGRRVYGVYFGTGDVQRPLARANDTVASDQRYLRNRDLAAVDRDIIGVIWDDDTTRNVTTQSPNFFNATAAPNGPGVGQGRDGWYIALGSSEKALRDPLVFQNVAYFKTFEPGADATECAAGSGVDRVYAINSCNAQPALDPNNNSVRETTDRVVASGSEDIGPDPFVLTPPDGPPIVVASGPMGAGGGGGVFQRAATLRPRIYNWRLPR